MLGGVVGSIGLPFWLEFERNSLGATDSQADLTSSDDEGLMISIPSYPDDPFLITNFGDQYFSESSTKGWEPVTHRERLQTIQGFHPDTVDWGSLVAFDDGDIRTFESQHKQLEFSLETGLSGSAGRNVTINIPNDDPVERYQSVFAAYDWQFPDGSSVEHPNDLLAEQFDGTPQEIEYAFQTNGIPSVFGPGALDFITYAAQQRLAEGYSSFLVDGIGVFRFQGLDFSVWAQGAFSTHLESLSASRRQELGIDDPGSFDIREYLSDEGLAPDDDGDPFEDPVFREYLLHHHQGVKDLFAAFQDRLHELFPERMAAGDIKIYGNHFMGNFSHPQAANVYVGDHLDLIYVEHFPQVDPPVDYHYKLEQAIGRFSKPAVAKGTIAAQDEANLGDFDPTKQYPNLKRFQIAESYAMGARMKLPLTANAAYSADQTFTNWIRADGTVPDQLQSFVDFLWTQERFLSDIESDTRVAVVWSLPTLLWAHEPQWGIGRSGDSPHVDSFVGTTTLLREAQIPYDVLVFGHPRLWDDDDQLARLSEYDAVVLPGVDSITDAQLTALETALDDGGHVITSGSPPHRDAMYEPRDDTPAVFDREETAVLAANPGRIKNERGETTGELRNALKNAGVQSMTAGRDPTLCVNRYVQSEPSRMVVHALNYDYSAGSDSFEPKTDVSLSVPKPDFTVGVARYYTPAGTTDLSVAETDQTLDITLPELTDWGFVVLARSADELVNVAAEADAREQTATVASELAAAREDGRDWADAFASAEAYHAAAETALDANAYGQALDAAQTADERLAKAHRQPVVGIDMGHGQPQSLDDDDPFAPLRNTFSQYDFRMLESWAESTFSELDVLLVPPALAYRGAQYQFSDDEVAMVESFVEGGGSLLVIARGGIDSGIDSLTEPFGFRFQGRPVVFETESNSQVEPTHPHHLLTRGVAELEFGLGTPIADRPSEATVLASLSEDIGAWFHQEEPLSERNETEGSAAGSDMYVTASYENGRVTLFGKHDYHLLSDEESDGETLVSNQLSVLGSEAIRAARSSQTATSTTEEAANSSTSGPSNTTTNPSPSEPSNTTTNSSVDSATSRSESDDEATGFSLTSGVLAGTTALLAGWLWNKSDGDN